MNRFLENISADQPGIMLETSASLLAIRPMKLHETNEEMTLGKHLLQGVVPSAHVRTL